MCKIAFCVKNKNFNNRLKPLLLLDKKVCRNSELNQGHRDFQSLALPTELLRHTLLNFHLVRLSLAEQALHISEPFRLSAPLGSYCGILY